MRVLEVSNLFPPDVLGGYEILAQDLVTSLRARGHEVEVLTTGDGSEQAGVTRTLQLSRAFGEKARSDRVRHLVAAAHNRRAMLRYFAEHGHPEVALVMSLRRLGVAPLRVLQELDIPFVVTVNDDWPVAYARPRSKGRLAPLRDVLDRRLLAFQSWNGIRTQHVIYLSGAVQEHIQSRGVPFPPGIVQSQGVDLKIFSPRRFRIIPHRPTLLFVGRLHPSKAPDVAIHALASLRQKGLDARLVIVGAADDASYAALLRTNAATLGVSEHVEWVGMIERTRLPDLYRSCDVALFTSRLEHEGQGLTWLEAMACGVQVVAFPSGGAKEFLDRHPVALRVDACTGDAFASAILDLLTRPDDQKVMVEAALDVVRQHGELEQYVSIVQGQLEEAIRASHRAREERGHVSRPPEPAIGRGVG
ncbi:MAG: glycosyltransferase family 4 protein [Deltaproteobacteria bacterium]|nr:glycosyltransferase family 4 protein [Deltaproteobacteria bacterium]